MRRKLLLFLSAIAISLAAEAEPMYMHVVLNNGTVKVLSVDEFDSMAFNGGVMSMSKADKKVTEATIADIAKVVFSESADGTTGIAKVAEGKGSFSIEGTSCIVVGDTAGTPLRIYDAGGANLLTISEIEAGTRVDISSLKKGIYIINLGKSSRKIEVR